MATTMAAPAHDCYPRDGELRPQHSRDDSRDSGIFHTTKGLWNAPGQNNCFLNSAVQVYCNITVFKIITSYSRHMRFVEDLKAKISKTEVRYARSHLWVSRNNERRQDGSVTGRRLRKEPEPLNPVGTAGPTPATAAISLLIETLIRRDYVPAFGIQNFERVKYLQLIKKVYVQLLQIINNKRSRLNNEVEVVIPGKKYALLLIAKQNNSVDFLSFMSLMFP
ncbi:hypothetical protein ACJJTC_007733 [Scirpophaga incertulas]